MRVAYLVGTWPEPSETFLVREVAGLRAHGLDVRVLALAPGPDGAAADAGYRPDGRDGAAWRALAHRARRHPSDLGRLLSASLRTPRWLRHLPTAAWLAESAADADLVHAAWASLPAQVAWMSRHLGGPAYTVAGHAQDVFGPAGCCRAALVEARGLTVCNRAAWRRWAADPVLRARLAWHPHGLPLAAWPVRTGGSEQPPVVLGVGRLVAKKGFTTLVRAMSRVPGARLVLLGEGPERAVLAAQARELGVDARLAGRVAEAEVAAWLARASVLALPSRVAAGGDRDGLANVLLEAMASGVPVVTTAAGSAEDAVAHRRTGLIVPPDDPAALAAALRAVLAEPALAAALAARARRLVEQRYTLEVNTLRLARWLTAAAGSREVDSCPTKLT